LIGKVFLYIFKPKWPKIGQNHQFIGHFKELETLPELMVLYCCIHYYKCQWIIANYSLVMIQILSMAYLFDRFLLFMETFYLRVIFYIILE